MVPSAPKKAHRLVRVVTELKGIEEGVGNVAAQVTSLAKKMPTRDASLCGRMSVGQSRTWPIRMALEE